MALLKGQFFVLALSLCALGANAFVGPHVSPKTRSMAMKPLQVNKNSGVFDSAMSKFKADYPEFSAAGWGPSAKAERWNGRHAMFGWFFIICTGYAQAHGLIPEADKLLDLKEWGTLAVISGQTTISNERAIVLIANVHAFMVGILAAFAPLSYMDKLLLEDGEEDEAPAGVFPPFDTGITPAAELWNGRMAMMGIVTATSYSLITGTPFMQTVNLWLGGLLIPN